MSHVDIVFAKQASVKTQITHAAAAKTVSLKATYSDGLPHGVSMQPSTGTSFHSGIDFKMTEHGHSEQATVKVDSGHIGGVFGVTNTCYTHSGCDASGFIGGYVKW